MVTGGTAPYSYQWNNSVPAIPNPTGLSAGNYSVTVTDANSHVAVYGLKLAEPTGIHLSTVIQNVSAHGGSDGCITLNLYGGTPDYSYHWSNNANIESPCGLIAGFYTVTVTDAFGCQSTATAHVQQPSQAQHNNHFNGNMHSTHANASGDSNGETKMEVIAPDNSTQPELTADNVTTYPNPATNSVNVRLETATSADLTLINALGQTIIHTKTEAAETRLDLSSVAKGNYILAIKTENSTVNKMVAVIK